MPHRLTGMLAACACVAGCAFPSTTPRLDETFGDSVRTNAAQQTLDPKATERNGSHVGTTDGRAVREAVDRAGDANRTPPKQTVINIGG